MTAPLESAVRKYLHELAPESRARLLAFFAREAEEFAHLLFRIIETLQLYHARNKLHDANEPKHFAFALMTKGANGLMAGFELAIGGYAWEPPILFRSALESFAVAWDVVHNSDRCQLWKIKKNFRSSGGGQGLVKWTFNINFELQH